MKQAQYDCPDCIANNKLDPAYRESCKFMLKKVAISIM